MMLKKDMNSDDDQVDGNGATFLYRTRQLWTETEKK